MRAESGQLALAAHVDQIVRDAGKVKGESDDHHHIESNDHPRCAQCNRHDHRAGEYCGEDGYSFAANCSFSSMEQCKAAIFGTYAACFRDPFLKDESIPMARPSKAAQPGRRGRQVEQRVLSQFQG